MNDKLINYAVLYLHSQQMQDKKIAKELSLPIKKIRQVLKENDLQSNTPNIKTASSKVSNKSLMINKTTVKGDKNVSIMTKAASEVSDSFRKSIDNSSSRVSKNAIYRPFEK